MDSLAIYFDTDAPSLAGLSHADFVEKFTDLVGHVSLYTRVRQLIRVEDNHTFAPLAAPVCTPASDRRRTGKGFVSYVAFILTQDRQIKMNQKLDKDTPRFDVQLLFVQIGVLLDDNQYRDAISLVDMYHFYIRQHQVRHTVTVCDSSLSSFYDSIKSTDPSLT